MARFAGTESYVATEDLTVAVNAAITLERPLLVKGEPGTGKSVLAEEIARSLNAPLITWHIKSTTKAQQGLYEYDAVSRLRDSQLGDSRVSDIRNYIKRGKLWDAFAAEVRPVLLIDEIDKADIEFPNDLLLELDRMEFFVYETGETIRATRRPIVVITSNNEKELPDAFLRRCFFHYIKFPDARDHGPDRRGALSRHQASAGRGGPQDLLRRARGAGPAQEALHLRAARLAQAPAVRGYRSGEAARARHPQAHPAAARGALEERAGCEPVREAGLHRQTGRALMLRLLLLRHAKAAWPGGVLDLDRPLAKRGQEASLVMADYLKRERLLPNLVIVSPARRTHETWERVQPIVGEIAMRTDGRIYEAPVGRLLEVVREAEPGIRTLMMIGHNPGFEELARLLIGEGDMDGILRLGQKYPTAGLAVIDFALEDWADVAHKSGRLERFVTPKSLGNGEDD